MENLYEIIGDVVEFGNGEKYYILDCRKIDQRYYCFSMNLNTQASEQKEKIIEVWLEDGELNGCKRDSEEYQSLLNEFQEPENIKRYMQFMSIQRDVLSKESKNNAK